MVTELTTATNAKLDGVASSSFSALKRTARVAGLWYLALAVTGIVGFLIVRSQIFAEGDAAATLANLTGNEALARLGLVAEMGVVVAQALAAVWFYKLFRSINHVAAWALAIFGMMNAVAIMASTAFLATALSVAGDSGLVVGGDAAGTVQLMYELSTNSWGVGAMFFGLWLIPMGYVVVTSGRMPVWLGRILIVGGAGYVLSAFIGYGVAGVESWLVEGLTYPATIGEFWMIGYLLTVGIRPPAAASESPQVA
ncbi:MAG: DUF4386 domain-containing protein [Acidimicrobiia bacterium]